MAIERLIPLLALISLVAGLAIGSQGADWITNLAQSIVSEAVHALTFIGPIIVGLSVAASLSELIRKKVAAVVFRNVVYWFFAIRIISALFTIAIVALIFRSPLLPAHFDAFSFDQLSVVFGNTIFIVLTGSIGFAVLIGWIGSKQDQIHKLLQSVNDGFSNIGDTLSFLIFPATFTLGIYISGLDEIVVGQAAGVSMAVQSPLLLYALSFISFVLIAYGWQIIYLYLVIRNRNDVTMKSFFTKYYIHVWPLAASTMSEVITFPLSLSKTRKAFPKMEKGIRSFVLSLGTSMNVTGNMINGFVIAGFISYALGYPISVLELLLVVPVISIAALGEVGFPGDSILLLGLTVVAMMAVPDNFMTNFNEVFLALWFTLEVGLQDCFRTGVNVTDNAIHALLFDNYYKQGNDLRTGLIQGLKKTVRRLYSPSW